MLGRIEELRRCVDPKVVGDGFREIVTAGTPGNEEPARVGVRAAPAVFSGDDGSPQHHRADHLRHRRVARIRRVEIREQALAIGDRMDAATT